MDRSHQGGVQCTWTITFACLIFELLPFVYFHIWILCGTYLQNCTSYGYEILLVDRSHQGGVQCTWSITLFTVFFYYFPLFIFILDFCPVHISKTILPIVMKFCGWIDLIKWECMHRNHNSCLLNFRVIALCLFSYLNFVWSTSPKLY